MFILLPPSYFAKGPNANNDLDLWTAVGVTLIAWGNGDRYWRQIQVLGVTFPCIIPSLL